MKKILLILLTLCLTIGLAACSGSNTSDKVAETDNEAATVEDSGALVVYFSVTGNTKD